MGQGDTLGSLLGKDLLIRRCLLWDGLRWCQRQPGSCRHEHTHPWCCVLCTHPSCVNAPVHEGAWVGESLEPWRECTLDLLPVYQRPGNTTHHCHQWQLGHFPGFLCSLQIPACGVGFLLRPPRLALALGWSGALRVYQSVEVTEREREKGKITVGSLFLPSSPHFTTKGFRRDLS